MQRSEGEATKKSSKWIECVVVESFVSSKAGDLDLVKGERVFVKNYDSRTTWWAGKKIDGIKLRGVFPSRCVQLANDTAMRDPEEAERGSVYGRSHASMQDLSVQWRSWFICMVDSNCTKT